MATAVNQSPIAIAGSGAVGATGLGMEPLQRAVAANSSALKRRELVIGKTSQRIVAGFVPDEIVAQLRASDAAHSDSRPFLFAAAALREAVKNAGGIVTDFSGCSNFIFGKELVATNPSIHPEFMDVFKNTFFRNDKDA